MAKTWGETCIACKHNNKKLTEALCNKCGLGLQSKYVKQGAK